METNWNVDVMLEQTFTEPVKVMSYHGIKYLTQIKSDKYYLKGVDENINSISLPKVQVLFAFANENLSAVKTIYQKENSAEKSESSASRDS